MSAMYCGGHGLPLPCKTCAENAARNMERTVTASDPAVQLGVMVMESVSKNKMRHVGYLCLNESWTNHAWPQDAEFVPLHEWEDNHAFTRVETVYVCATGAAS